MTVRELIDALQEMPPDASVVFRHTRDDVPPDYVWVDCFYEDGEVFIDIHGDDDDVSSAEGLRR